MTLYPEINNLGMSTAKIISPKDVIENIYSNKDSLGSSVLSAKE